MSSLFNYELDENNIRTTLQNARHPAFDEASWNEFEENFSKKLSKPSTPSFIKFPDIQLNINRNVILPVAFILALVGVSAIMLSFIDFKPDAEQQVERKLEPNPENYAGKTQVQMSSATNHETESAKPKVAVTVLKKDSVVMNPVVPVNLAGPSSVTSNTHMVSIDPVPTGSSVATKTPDTPVLNKGSQSAVTPSVQNVYYKQRRKKAEKVPEEQMETIKAPALIKEEAETSEPELEIKID